METLQKHYYGYIMDILDCNYIRSLSKLEGDISSDSGIFAHIVIFIDVKVLLHWIGKRRVYNKKCEKV